MKQKFDICAKLIKKSNYDMTNDELLTLYGLYKQAIYGNCNTSQPSLFHQKDLAKWKAWMSQKNMTKENAMSSYSQFVENMIKKYDK